VLDEQRNRVDLITLELREQIVDGRLKPGTRIRQEAVAQHYGISRIPVREALRQLHTEGLVTLEMNVGARVASLDVADLIEIYDIREQVEPLAIRRSAANLSDEQLETLAAYLSELEAIGDDAGARWFELDRQFHHLSYGACEMPRLLRLIKQLWDASQQYRRVYRYPDHPAAGVTTKRYELTRADHRLILDALEHRDSEAAAQMSRMHIRRVRVALSADPPLTDQAPRT
jgi:DNA-binding GntR family transcriptional regulator